MVAFCPFCANLLFVEENVLGRLQFTCKICPVFFPIKSLLTFRNYNKLKVKQVSSLNGFFLNFLTFKEIDDVLGGEDAWKNVDSTEARCPECSHDHAYFMQLQTRSADEPMTTFYRCCNPQCNHNWRD